MAYLDTSHMSPSAPVVRHPLLSRLAAAHPATAARPALDWALKSHLRDVQHMLLAAALAGATVVAVAGALLLRA